MAQDPSHHESGRVFVLPMSDFPVYYLPERGEIVSCLVPPAEKEAAPIPRRGPSKKKRGDSEGDCE